MSEIAERPDPFAGILAFVERMDAAGLTTAGDRPVLDTLGTPLDVSVDRFIDFEALEALASWSGGFKMPILREKDDPSYPMEIEEQMRICEPQFFLRNIGRADRFADPDEALGMDRRAVDYGMDPHALDEVRNARYTPPELSAELGQDLMGRQREARTELYVRMEWARHFGAEVKAKFDGPIWRYDPDAPVEEKEEGAVPSKGPEEHLDPMLRGIPGTRRSHDR